MDWDSRLPMDIRTISTELLRATFPDGIDLLLASPSMLARHVPETHRERTPVGPDVDRHILHLIMYLSKTHPEGIGYLWNSSECHPASEMGQGNLLDATQCGSGAGRNTRIWQKLLPRDILEAEHARLRPPTHLVDAALKAAGLANWSHKAKGSTPTPTHSPGSRSRTWAPT
jgi:hypothetical protein